MQNSIPNDCFAPSSALMAHDEAVGLLKARISPVANLENVGLESAGGRVLGRAVTAPHDVPNHTNSAVDGYAFCFSDYDAVSGSSLPVGGRAAAGHPIEAPVPSGHGVRILTGAVLPDGVDTVVMQEDVTAKKDGGAEVLHLPAGLKQGSNIRRAGEDLKAGSEILSAGHILRPQDLAALASIGMGKVPCHRRLKVGIVSSGDEIVRAGSGDLGVGQVFDANAPMLDTLARLAGCEPVDLGIWPDRRDEVQSRLEEASRSLDVTLTSGGASTSEEDHMSAALATLGSRHFWRISVKPGRPMMFGQIGSSMMIGLPGNPVAVFVCFLIYVYPLLRRLSGTGWLAPQHFLLPADFEFPKRKLGRREYWRASLVQGKDGMAVEKFARDGSGLISGLRAADGLVEVEEDVKTIQRGDLVRFIPFSQFGILGS